MDLPIDYKVLLSPFSVASFTPRAKEAVQVIARKWIAHLAKVDVTVEGAEIIDEKTERVTIEYSRNPKRRNPTIYSLRRRLEKVAMGDMKPVMDMLERAGTLYQTGMNTAAKASEVLSKEADYGYAFELSNIVYMQREMGGSQKARPKFRIASFLILNFLLSFLVVRASAYARYTRKYTITLSHITKAIEASPEFRRLVRGL